MGFLGVLLVTLGSAMGPQCAGLRGFLGNEQAVCAAVYLGRCT